MEHFWQPGGRTEIRARDLGVNKLARTMQVVGLAEVPDVVRQMFAGSRVAQSST